MNNEWRDQRATIFRLVNFLRLSPILLACAKHSHISLVITIFPWKFGQTPKISRFESYLKINWPNLKISRNTVKPLHYTLGKQTFESNFSNRLANCLKINLNTFSAKFKTEVYKGCSNNAAARQSFGHVFCKELSHEPVVFRKTPFSG